MKLNLQLFGGRGASAGGSRGGSAGGSRASEQKISDTVKKAKIVDRGRGQWEMDIPGIGGGVITDETDSYYSGDTRYGKVYSTKVWDGNYDTTKDSMTKTYSNLNDAKADLRARVAKLNGANLVKLR